MTRVTFAWDRTIEVIGHVLLRCEDEIGYPTQTWLTGVFVEWDHDGRQGWHAPTGLPLTIYHINQIVERHKGDPNLCYLLRLELTEYEDLSNPDVNGGPSALRHLAFADYVREVMASLGCSLDA